MSRKLETRSNSVAAGFAFAALVVAASSAVCVSGCRRSKEHKVEPAADAGGIAIKDVPAPVKIIYPAAPGSFVELAKRLDPSVVTIKSTSEVSGGPKDMFPGFEGPPSGPMSLGSG